MHKTKVFSLKIPFADNSNVVTHVKEAGPFFWDLDLAQDCSNWITNELNPVFVIGNFLYS